MEVVAKESKNAGLVKPVDNDFKNNLAAMLAKGMEQVPMRSSRSVSSPVP